MSREDIIIAQRVQPFISIDHEVLKECRKRGAATPEMLLTYFVLQEMAATGEWSLHSPLSEDRISELSGLGLEAVEKSLNEFDSMGVFNEEG